MRLSLFLTILFLGIMFQQGLTQMVNFWQKVEPVSGGTTRILHDTLDNIFVVGKAYGPKSLQVIKYDKYGFLQWKKSYGNGNWYCTPRKVAYDSKGYILISGEEYNSTSDEDIFLYKLDLDGNVIYRFDYQSFGFDLVQEMKFTRDSCALISSRVESSTGFDFHLMKINQSGSLLWDKVFPTGSPYWHYELGESTSGKITLCYSAYVGTTMTFFLRKLDSAGNQIWADSGTTAYTNFHLNDSDIAVVISPVANNHLATFIDSSGTQLATDVLWPTSVADYLTGIDVDIDGNFYFYGKSQGNVKLMKYSSGGNMLWNRTYQLPSPSIGFQSYQLEVQNDKIYAWGTAISDSNIAYTHDIFVLAFDTSGQNPDLIYLEYPGYSGSIQNTAASWSFGKGQTLCLMVHRSTNPQTRTLVNICTKECNGNLNGQAWNDFNKNCFQDSSELALHNPLIHVLPVNNWLTGDSSGYFKSDMANGQYTLTHQLPKYWKHACPSNDTINVIIDSLNPQSINNKFGAYPLPDIHDLEVKLISPNARPGFNHTLFCNFYNAGTQTENGVVLITTDSIFDFISSVPSPDSIVGNSYYFSFTNLNLLEDRQIRLFSHIDSSVFIGTSYVIDAKIFPIVDDTVPVNNYDTISWHTTGAVDPNDKAVDPLIFLPAQDRLTYTIRFQNTGSDTAFNIYIRDTISLDLDLSTLRILGSSHEYEFSILPGRILQWSFINILLPDSGTNEALSHGFVMFDIDSEDNLNPGHKILNRAGIYFDFQLPVITNFATTEVYTPGVHLDGKSNTNIDDQLICWPNPARNYLNINFPPLEKVKVVNVCSVAGTLIDVFWIQKDSRIVLKVEGLNQGYYFLQIQTEDGIYHGRFMK